MSRGLGFLLAGALLVAACADDQPTGDDPSGLRAGDSFVALGDSYTAAAYTGSVTEPAQGCTRSNGNYPHLVAEELELELTDVSCGGAKTADLFASQTTRLGITVPPQLDAVTESTDLVTLSIGGNDFRLVTELFTSCVYGAIHRPTEAPCAEDYASLLEVRLTVVQQSLVTAVERIRDRAPEARVVVVSYPQIYPADGGCSNLLLAAGDLPYARQVVQGLVDAQRAAAEATDADFLDVFAATVGHDMCSDEPWIAGYEVQRTGKASPYHPYPEHQQAVAELLVDLLR